MSQFNNPFCSNDMSKFFDMSKISEFYKSFDMSKIMNPTSYQPFDSQSQELPKAFSDQWQKSQQSMGDFQKYMQQTMQQFSSKTAPFIDMEALISIQRKNVEVLSAFSQSYYDALQALWRRQLDSYRQMMEDNSQMFRAIMSSPTPEERAKKQAELSKVAMEKYMNNLRDASETFSRFNSQAVETVGQRVNESLNEVYGVVKNMTTKAA